MAKNNNPGRILKGTKSQPSLKGASGVWTLDEALQYHRANQWPQPNLFQPVANSIRNSLGKTSYISRESPGRSGSQRKFTFSWWLKKNSNATSSQQHLHYSYDGSRLFQIFFERGGATNPDCICVYGGSTDVRFIPVVRDTSAWYHIVIAVDIDQATSTNTIKCWINGVQITTTGTQGGSPGTPSWPTSATNWPINQAGVYQRIGGNAGGGTLDGQFAEINFVDGAQLQPTLFGQFDTNNTWVPIPYTGSYGTNGFYLPFTNATTSQTLGYDASLNGTATYTADQDPYRGSVALHLTGNGPAGGQNNTFADSGPNNYAVTRNGAVTQGSFSPFSFNTNAPYNPAQHGASMYQAAVDSDFPSFPTGSQGSNFTFAGDFTIEGWVYYLSASSGDTSLYVTSQDGSSYFAFNISMTSGNYNIYLNSGATAIAHGITANTWTHVAMVRSGSTVTLYTNGVSKGTLTNSSTLGYSTMNLNRCGGGVGGVSRYVSSFRIVKAAIYTAAFTPTNRPFGTLTNNLLPFSEDFTNSYWTVNAASITPGATIAPDGTPTGALFAWTTATAQHYIIRSSLTTIGNTVTASVYVKAKPNSAANWMIFGDLANNYMYINLLTGTIGTLSQITNAAVTSVGNGWFRISGTWTSGGASSGWGAYVASADNVSNPAGTDTTSGFYIWGAQLETGSTLGNYTPTPANYSTTPALLLNFANAAIVDSAGGNDVVTIGSATISSASKYGSGALNFNGSTDRLEISGPSAQSSGSAGLYGLTPNLIPGTKDFTVEYWLYTRTGNDTYHRIVSSTNGAFGSGTLCMRHQPGSFLFSPNLSYATDFTLNTWTHVAYTRQGTVGRGFINGRQVGICTDVTNYTEAIQYVGSFYSAGAGEYFNGMLDDVRITMGVSRYNTDFTPPARALPETGGKSFVTTNVNAGVVQSFTTTGTTSWTAPSDVTQIEVLVVAGGGSGAGGSGGGAGGGGAGGLIYNNSYPVTPGQTYTVTVGAGGQASNRANFGYTGSNSVFGALTAIGGGGGGCNTTAGQPGGSGGGSGEYATPDARGYGGAGTAGQGFAGGNTSQTGVASGGGGAGGLGGNGSNSAPGSGGAGLLFGISGAPQYYAGGGGASGNSLAGAAGGSGVGGNGGAGSGGSGTVTAGATNTGSGGGGIYVGASGAGGSGIVIIRYTTTAVGNSSDATSDNLVDSPTLYGHDMGMGGEVVGNYATWNPLIGANMNTSAVIGSSVVVYTNGNLNASNPIAAGQAPRMQCHSNIGMTTGKWYAEFTNITTRQVGISKGDYQTYSGTGVDSLVGYYSDGTISGNVNGSTFSYTGTGVALSATDVVGVAFDADAATLTWYVNGVSKVVATSITSTTRPTSPWYFSSNPSTSGATSSVTANFGQRPWAYTPPQGFNALTTKNLPRPVVGSAAATPNQFFDVATYAGNSSTQTISSLNFQPDLIWIKSRSNAYSHWIGDSVRGFSVRLYSDGTAAEAANPNGGVTAVSSTGFTVSAGAETNNTSNNYVAWCWRAGGAAVANTSGTITSQVSANTTSGFSIVSYTGGTTAGKTVGHGLNSSPNFVIIKSRSDLYNWIVYHSSLANTQYLKLNGTDAAITDTTMWNSTSPSSTVITLGTNGNVNNNTNNYIAYCWTEIPGFSKFGTYTANGSSDGPFVYCGFKPRWIMLKAASSTSQWVLIDTARDTYNTSAGASGLFANAASAEETGNTSELFDIVSNGFKLRSNGRVNVNSVTHIFAAFADKPFGNVNGTAR